jgi:hypothetical protein
MEQTVFKMFLSAALLAGASSPLKTHYVCLTLTCTCLPGMSGSNKDTSCLGPITCNPLIVSRGQEGTRRRHDGQSDKWEKCRAPGSVRIFCVKERTMQLAHSCQRKQLLARASATSRVNHQCSLASQGHLTFQSVGIRALITPGAAY